MGLRVGVAKSREEQRGHGFSFSAEDSFHPLLALKTK